MKTKFKANLTLSIAMLAVSTSFSQTTVNSLKKSEIMGQSNIQSENKQTIRFLYDSIFNTKNFEKFSEIISTDYTNSFGNKGIEGFQKSIIELAKAFPDAHWEMEDIVAEGNKVIVKQKFIGTHTNAFQDIPATNNKVAVNGMTTYELQNKKIVYSQVQTDRYGFLQQLGQLEVVTTHSKPETEYKNIVYFIDQFMIPEKSVLEFMKQMKLNREFVKTLSGYIKSEAFQHYDEDGNLVVITIAVWENQDQLNRAKSAVQKEFKRTGFNPSAFNKRLQVKMERGEFTSLK